MFRPTLAIVVLAAFAALASPGQASAQNSRADPASHMTTPGTPGTPGGILNPGDLEKFRDVDDRTSAKARALAKLESSRLTAAMGLPCEVTEAQLIGRGETRLEGKAAELKAYEVACADGTGYILESAVGQAPVALSCFAAAATRAADLAAGGRSELYCQLPPNKDPKAMAAALLAPTGIACSVTNVRWFGLSTSGQMEYSEVACGDSSGYLLKTPRTGAPAQTAAISCQEAAKQGLQCRLTDGGPVAKPVTADTFRQALRENAAGCERAEIRLVGRESLSRRYVVEVRCPEQPAGLVAFIPLEGNTNKFETIDCAAALARGITCQLAPK